jgi:hypothetical protein
MGPTGPTGSRGQKGAKGDKGDVGEFDAITKKQLIMINKNFGQITYPHAFQTFEFEDSGTDAPTNNRRGGNLVVKKSTTNEAVPILGPRAPIIMTQPAAISDVTEISFTALYSQAQSYGVIFAIQDHDGNTAKTVSMNAYSGTLVSASPPIKRLGLAEHDGKTTSFFPITKTLKGRNSKVS